MKCQRCDRDGKAIARVTSEILNVAVCAECLREALDFVGPNPDELTINGGLPEFDETRVAASVAA